MTGNLIAQRPVSLRARVACARKLTRRMSELQRVTWPRPGFARATCFWRMFGRGAPPAFEFPSGLSKTRVQPSQSTDRLAFRSPAPALTVEEIGATNARVPACDLTTLRAPVRKGCRGPSSSLRAYRSTRDNGSPIPQRLVVHFERRLCRRNEFLGGGSEGGQSPPPSLAPALPAQPILAGARRGPSRPPSTT
jgi:hypothetical protein